MLGPFLRVLRDCRSQPDPNAPGLQSRRLPNETVEFGSHLLGEVLTREDFFEKIVRFRTSTRTNRDLMLNR